MKKLILSISGVLLITAAATAQTAVGVNSNENSSPAVTVSAGSAAISSGSVGTSTYTRWQDDDDDPMRSKTFTKSFSLSKGDKVNLSNQFGSITIKTWDKNEIKVDAVLKAYANTEAEAQQLLDNANISADKTGDQATFKTEIGNNKNNWGRGSRNGKKWRREIKVYLTVYMPATNALTAAQKYGNINLDDFAGSTSLKVQFGNLVTGNLSNNNNYISVQYGKASLKTVSQAKINHQFGDGLSIDQIGTIDLDAQYTGVKIGTIKGDANLKLRFGKGITIGSAGNLTLDGQYTTVKLTTLSGNATAKIQFGKLFIDEIGSGCKNLDVNSHYSDVNLGFAANYGAGFEVSTSYGGFKYGDNVSAKKLGENSRGFNPTKNYNGQVGKGGASTINIKSQFGSVTFK